MLNEETYGFEVDVYCLGIVLYELFYFRSPFCENEKAEVLKNIKEGCFIFDDRVRKIPDSAKDLILALLKPKNQRIKLESIFNHPFL